MATASTEPAGYLEGLAWLARRDHLGQAEAAFRAGLAECPEHAGCTLQLGVSLRVQGRWREAAEMLERARRLAPADPQVHLQWGNLHRAQGRPVDALAAYDAALRLDPGHPYIRFQRARTLQQLHRLEEALAGYDQLGAGLDAETAASYHLAEWRNQVASRLARLADHGIDSNLPPQQLAAALYRRANALVRENALDPAVELYEEAASMAPDFTDPEFQLGETVPIQLERQPREAYPSCRWIEEGLFFLQDTALGICCTQHPSGIVSPIVGSYHGGPVPVDFVLARRQQLRNANRAGADNACRQCHALQNRAWAHHPWLFGALILGNHTVCNQSCSFCTLAQTGFREPAYYYMVDPPIAHLIAHGWLSPGALVSFGGGEPTLSSEFPRLSERLLAHGCRLTLYSNATRMVPALLEALRQGRCDLVTSVDSGTPATFYRMKFMSESVVLLKGRPAFETVWANLAEYARACSDRVIVKYIFTPDNIAEADLTGYLDLCQAHGVTRIMLSPEVGQIISGTVPEAIWRAIHRTKRLAQGRGLTVLFHVPYFGAGREPQDLPGGPILSEEELAFAGLARNGSTWSRDRDDFMDLTRLVATPPPPA